MEFAISLTRDDDGRVRVTCVGVPGAQAVGEYEEDALARARDALTGVLAACVKERRAIPRPSRQGRRRIAVPALAQIKIALYEAMLAANVTRAELARRLRCHRPQVDRLLDLRHASTLGQLEAALAAMGKRVVVGVETVSATKSTKS